MFSEWVKAKREELRLSQQDCAKRAKVSQAGWQKYEADNTQPRRATVEKIANALGVPVAEALIAAGFSAKNWIETDAEITNIVHTYIHPARRTAFVQAIRAMAIAMNDGQSISA